MFELEKFVLLEYISITRLIIGVQELEECIFFCINLNLSSWVQNLFFRRLFLKSL